MSPARHAVAVVLLAVAIDLAFGDPPNRWHPVAWIGRALSAGRERLCHGSPTVLFVSGGALTLGAITLAAVAGGLVAMLAQRERRFERDGLDQHAGRAEHVREHRHQTAGDLSLIHI